LVLSLLLQPSRKEQVPPPQIQPVVLAAIDTSRSMNQQDVKKDTRLEAAKQTLLDAELVPRDGVVNDPELRLFEFHEDAKLLSGSLLEATLKARPRVSIARCSPCSIHYRVWMRPKPCAIDRWA